MKVKLSVKNAAIAALAGAACGCAAAYTDIAMLLAPAVLASVLVVWGAPAFALSALCAAAGAFALLSFDISALYIVALIIPASLVIGEIVRRKLPYRTAVMMAALIMGVALYLEFCLSSILAGNDPFAAVAVMLDGLSSEIGTVVSQAAGAELTDELKVSLALLSDSAPTITMIGSVCPAMIFALVDTVLVRLAAKRAGVATKPMTHFALWQLSKQYNYASTAALAAAIVCIIAKLDNASAVLTAALCVTGGPLALMGVCVLEFSTRMRGASGRMPRIILYICLVLSVPYSFIMLAIIGTVDRFTKVRRKFKPKKDPNGGDTD